MSGLPALADDSGIEVDALGGRPGVWSARYAGEHASDADNLNLLLRELAGVPEGQRRARYRCVLVFVRAAADPDPIVTERCLGGPRAHGAARCGWLWLRPASFNLTDCELSAAQLPAGAEERHQSPGPGAARAAGRAHMMLDTPPLALYLHFPWCVRKCPYCDFNSYTLNGALPEAEYLAALSRDMRAQATAPQVSGRRLTSIFMGGGTPSLFSPAAIGRVLEEARALFGFAPAAATPGRRAPPACIRALLSGCRTVALAIDLVSR